MSLHLVWLVASLVFAADIAHAQEPCSGLIIQGTVPEGPETHFFLPFEVPVGIAEIEVRHDDLSSENILDWGLDDPNGFRGWGGGNSEPAVVGIQAASRSYVPGPMPMGTWEVVVGKAKIVETPGAYDVCIILRTEPTLPPQPREPYEDPGVLDNEARWYAGDFHVHSRQSGDASPSIPETLEFAQDAGLDFIMLSEHNTNSGLTLYRSAQRDFPKLLIVPGVEWTTYSGHANAIGAIDWVDHKTGVRGASVEAAIEAFQTQGALFSPTHPEEPSWELCIGCEWEYDVDPGTLDGVEVQTGVWAGIGLWEDYCRLGSHAVALGGSDDHDAGQRVDPIRTPIGTPTTMVFADGLSVDAILDGVRNGRTVVKVNGLDGPMLETELSGERLGDTVFADKSTLSVRVTAATGEALEVIKNGAVVETLSIDDDPFTHEMSVEAPTEGEDRYRHQVVRANMPLTVGSYVWLQAAEPTTPGNGSTGCSCRLVSVSDYDTGMLLAALGLGMLFWRRRRTC